MQKFASQTIPDDPQLEPRIKFEEGIVSFAGNGKNSRTSHLFVAYGPNPYLGREFWETPIGVVVKGMETLRDLNDEYREKPEQWKISTLGEEYMREEFPRLDRFLTCHVLRQGEESQLENMRGDDGNDGDDGETDDAEVENISEEVENISEEVKENKTLLRKTVTNQDPTESGSHGFEVPIIFAVVALIFLLYGLKRRSMRNHSKSS